MPRSLRAAETLPDEAAWVRGIADAEIRTGVEDAILKNLLPAATEQPYPGHFTITADGGAFGTNVTWPGLDSWQMAGAYLRLGRTRLVLDYLEFVRASQRPDGNLPFAIFPGDTRSDGKWLRGLRHPEDVFTYTPPTRDGTASCQPAAPHVDRLVRTLAVEGQPVERVRSHLLSSSRLRRFSPPLSRSPGCETGWPAWKQRGNSSSVAPVKTD